MNKGHVTQVMGPVVDVKFADDKLPKIYNALTVEIDTGVEGQESSTLTLEVALHLGDNSVRTIAMSSTDGVQRGVEVTDLGGPIAVPVGEVTLGRVFNVLVERIDLDDPRHDDTRFGPIHRDAQEYGGLSTEPEVLETGINVVDVLPPYIKGGKIGLFGGSGVGKPVLI